MKTIFLLLLFVTPYFAIAGFSANAPKVSPDTAICKGNAVSLIAHNLSSYAWSTTNNATVFSRDSIVLVTPDSTTYYIVSDGSYNDTIKVTVNPLPVITVLPKSTFVCEGGYITLTATGGKSYTWSPYNGLSTTTGDSVLASPTATITYTISSTDSLGCSGIAFDTLTVVPIPNRPTISMSQDGDTLISSATQGNQWYKNDTLIPGATNQILVITGNRNYFYLVIVTDPKTGCSSGSDSDICTGITCGIIHFKEISRQVSIYPNPVISSLSIAINSSAEDLNDWNLQLKDVLGRTVLIKSSVSYHNYLDVSDLSNGIYFLVISTKSGRAVIPVVKQ